jgi:hypothetical protein
MFPVKKKTRISSHPGGIVKKEVMQLSLIDEAARLE